MHPSPTRHPFPVRTVIAAAAWALCSAAAAAPAMPVGPVVAVNDVDVRPGRVALAAGSADGSFAVFWQRDDSTALHGRRFSVDGTPAGPSVVVLADVEQRARELGVAMDDDGDAVLVWRETPDTTNGTVTGSIVAQRLDSALAPVGAPIVVSPLQADRGQQQPTVAFEADGDFAIAWSDIGLDRRTAASGASAASAARANLLPSFPLVPYLIDFLQFTRSQLTPTDTRIKLRRYAADGTPVGPAVDIERSVEVPALQPLRRFAAVVEPTLLRDRDGLFLSWVREGFNGDRNINVVGIALDAAGQPRTAPYFLDTDRAQLATRDGFGLAATSRADTALGGGIATSSFLTIGPSTPQRAAIAEAGTDARVTGNGGTGVTATGSGFIATAVLDPSGAQFPTQLITRPYDQGGAPLGPQQEIDVVPAGVFNRSFRIIGFAERGAHPPVLIWSDRTTDVGAFAEDLFAQVIADD